jgi:hypothetical protein
VGSFRVQAGEAWLLDGTLRKREAPRIAIILRQVCACAGKKPRRS